MTTTDYRPVSCDRHSEYELLAMRRARVRLDADTPTGPLRGLSCRVVDVYTRDGAEYLQLATADGERFACRLDRIVALTPQA